MITFEKKNDDQSDQNNELEIYLDLEGADYMIKKLSSLILKKTDHIHLMSEDWGGDDLQCVANGEGNDVIHHVKIYFK